MNWLILAVICLLGWGLADLFYKKGTDQNDRNSHLKIGVWVGLVMGLTSVILYLFFEPTIELSSLFIDMIKYSPASLCYIISMIIGYAGLRYLELSIASPVQNASGGLSAVFMLIYFTVIGKITNFFDEFSYLDIIGTVFIITGVIALAVVENKLSSEEKKMNVKDRKYRYGALALLFPILYCLFDTFGTAADGIILDEEAGLGLSEIDVLILYGLTFFLVGIIAYIIILVKEKKPYNPFAKKELTTKGIAAVCEEFGQIFYVYSMASKPMLVAPIVGSYCIVSVILSAIFLKERLKRSQLISVILVIIGIVILAVSEGMSEA